MMIWKTLFLVLMCGCCLPGFAQGLRPDAEPVDSMQTRFQQNTHRVVLDTDGKIVPWYQPQQMAYDQFIRQRWNFIKTRVPKAPGPSPRADYPAYYFYCAFRPVDGQLMPDTWMNDVG